MDMIILTYASIYYISIIYNITFIYRATVIANMNINKIQIFEN